MKKRKMTKKMKIQLICAAVIVVVLIIASLYTVVIQPRQSKETYAYKEETVVRGDVVQGVTETGQITMGETYITYDIDITTDEDDEDSDDSSDDEDDEEEEINYLEIGQVFVTTGQRIAEGDPLFSITEKSREAVMKKLSRTVTEKEIALSEAKAEYDSSMLEAKSTYDSSMVTANSASAQLNATTTQLTEEMNGLYTENAILELEIKQCQEKLIDEDFMESLSDALTAYEKAKEKYEETDAHSTTAYNANYSSYASAKSTYDNLLSQQTQWQNTIDENLETINANNARIMEKQSILEAKQADADNAYQLDKAEGELAADIYNFTKESLLDSVDTAQQEYDSALETLNALQEFVGDDGVIYADGAGLVTAVAYEEGDELVRTGTMLSYVKEADYTVSVDVSEEDIAGISIGDSVRVIMEAYPDEEYAGTVQSVTTTKTSDYANTVSYPVNILIQGDTTKLFGGMTAEITFVNELVSDVLYVSRKAIVKEEGKTYVYVGEGEEKRMQEVTTGFENSTLVEIKEGLSEGDIIYIRSSVGGQQ